MSRIFKEQFNFFKYLCKTYFYKVILAFIIIVYLFYSGMTIFSQNGNISFLDLVTSVLSTKVVIFLSSIIAFLYSYYIYNLMYKNELYKLRLAYNKNIDKKVIQTIIFQTIIPFFIGLLIILISLNIIAKNPYDTIYISERGTYNFIYFSLFVIRYYTWFVLLAVFQYWLLKNFNKKIILSLSFIYSLFLFFEYLPSSVYYGISSIMDIKIHLSIFLYNVYYSSFIFEVLISLLYICVFSLILKFLFLLKIDRKIIYERARYIFMELKQFLLKENKSILFYVIFTLIVCIYKITTSKIISIDLFKSTIGYLSLNTQSIINLLIILFNFVFICYLAIRFLINKMSINCGYILLREKTEKFILNNQIIVYLLVLSIKLVSYVIVTIPFLFMSSINIYNLLLLIGLDILYNIIVLTTMILIFFVYYCYKELSIKKIFIIGLCLIVVLLNYIFFENIYVEVIIALFVLKLIVEIFTKNGTKILEQIEGGK